ncbi:MAG: helix-hairpin-helix domain-containing protein [Chloroflexota bacterium]
MEAGDWQQRLRWPLTIAIVALVLVGGALLLRQEPPPLVVSTPVPQPRELSVYVSGAVARPGVYQFIEGARVEDALLAAGGPSTDADLNRLNLSLRLRDEQHVQVPARLGASTSAVGGIADGMVNLNTATLEQLDTLPGVGPVTAKKIVDQRERSGPFQRVDELLELKIVNSSTFANIKGRITAP